MELYPVLRSELDRRGIRLTAVSRALGITDRTLRNKLNGQTDFTWPEVCRINEQFFPDLKKDELFMREEANEGKSRIQG